MPPVQIGEVMRGAAIGIIKASKSDTFPVGSYATGTVGWTEFAVVNEKDLQKTDIPKNGKVTDALGVLGKRVLLDLATYPRRTCAEIDTRHDWPNGLLRPPRHRKSQSRGLRGRFRRSRRNWFRGRTDRKVERCHCARHRWQRR